MPLRFKALTYTCFNSISLRKIFPVVFLFVLQFGAFAQANLEDVKKEANKLFEDDEFTSAYKLYSQLVSNYPKDPEYNYRLGVCMIYSEPDKKKCLPFLQQANKSSDVSRECKFYLGKAYHINYQFDEAIKYYNEYKKVGSGSMQKKLQVDREVKACAYGKRLLSNLSDLVVQSKKSLNEADYFRSYDLKSIGGKLLAKPEEFKTAPDKKKKDKSIVFLPRSGDRVYFSSYGPNTDNGRDIYYKTRLPNGEFGPAVKVKGINTEFDEDFPFLHPNGKTLYFASKGYNSMGGYDIFKSTYVEATDSWSQPENLEFPINSPDDDYLFVTDSLEKTAYFSTGRQSLPGKIDVLRINTERKPIDILALKGTVVKENSEQSLKSVITVKNMATGQAVNTYSAQDNGDYFMDLPNGAKLLFTVETPGLKTQSDEVSLPVFTISKPLKQTISYDNGILKIINYFDEAPSDDSYVQYLKIIEEKAQLNPNQGKNNLDGPKVQNGDPANRGKTNTNSTPKDSSGTKTVASNTPAASKTATTNTKGVDNKQLSNMAKQEAEEALKEANALQQDANDGFELGNAIKIEAGKKMSEYEEAMKNAQAITNEEEKKAAIDKATAIKAEADNQTASSEKIIGYAKALEEDAKNKKIEAGLSNEYAKELDKVITSKNTGKAALDKLDELEKQISEVSSRKNQSETAFNTFKNDIDEKEKQIQKIEQSNNDVKSSIQEVKTAISESETDLAATKKKKDKEPIQQKITELKTEQQEKEKQVAANDSELIKLKEELNALKNNLDLANRVKNETIAAPVKTSTAAVASGTTSVISNSGNSGERITSKSLDEKFKDKIVVTDNTSKTNIEEANNQLKTYNREIDAAITKNKSDLAKAKTNTAKQELNTEIKTLENTKKQNQQQIAANSKQIAELGKAAPANANNGPDLTPLSSNNMNDALKQLENLNNKLNSNDNANFEYNGYQNVQAQGLKVEADSKINEAAAQQKKLKDIIAAANGQIRNATPVNSGNSPVTAASLNSEADEFSSKAIQYRNEAINKSGAEKDDLVAKAKDLESKTDEKRLAAADVTMKDNKAVYETNNENINTLKNGNKASESDLSEVRRLTDEAATAFKQAANMREEGNAMTGTAAKLGNFGNAEEKEAEGLSKQQQALFILKKNNPGAALKTPVTSTSSESGNTASSTATLDLSVQLQSVNNGLAEFGNSRLAAYQKLYDANKTELEQITSGLKSNQASIDKTPALKSDVIAGNNKITKSEGLKQSSDLSADNNKKLNDLISATKLQVEAINQLNNVSKKISQSAVATNAAVTNTTATTSDNTTNNSGNETAATKTITAGNNTSDGNETASTKTTSTSGNQTAANTTTKTTAGNQTAKTPTVSETASTKTIAPSNSAPTPTVDMADLVKKDTSTAQIISYVESNKVSMKNPGANQLVKNTVSELKKIENEKKVIDEQLKNTSGNTVNETPATLKSKADNLFTEAENLGVKAFDARTQANNKSGTEKDKLIAEADNYDKQSQDKKLEAIALNEKANELNYNNNNEAIRELVEKAKKDNPSIVTQLEQTLFDINALKTQSGQLRQEGNAQTNTTVKIGSMMNAEEKESEILQKQNQVLTELKKQYPDYVVKEPGVAGASVEELKQKQVQLQEKQYTELTNLANAYSLEYETSKTSVPENLDNNQQAVKKNAEELNAESKRLLIKSVSETNPNEKMKLLAMAAKTGNAAVDQLNKIAPSKAVANNTGRNNNNGRTNNTGNTGNPNTAANNTGRINNTNTGANPPGNNENTATNPGNTNATATARNGTVKIEGLEVTTGNAYNAEKPIPIDAKMPDGLVFRVQIGAFKTALPNNAFRGLSPLNGENASNGYIRYTAGNFNKLENANAVKNDLKGLGYNDAFVVVYYNGKRITLAEALEILTKEGKKVDNAAPTSAGITANANIPKATSASNANLNTQDAPPVVTKELEQTNDLLYTVQIGVFTKQISKRQLFNLQPIYTEKLPSGLYRYTAGIYNNPDRLITDKGRVVNLGVKDAFVSAYFNGKRISFAEGKTKQQDNGTKMEAENPIIFPEGGNLVTPPVTNTVAAPVNTIANTPPVNNTPPATTVQPFTNNVSAYPEATAENGIKATQDGVCFKVQIGAYSKQVPNDVAAKFSEIKNWPIENKFNGTLYIYNVGNYVSARFARTLLEEAKRIGIADAFIAVYRDGQKVSGAEATQLMSQQ